MIRIDRNRVAALAAAVALGWAVAGTGTADAAQVADVGWWSRNPLSSAPEGGFAVGAAPDGPTAVAAVRLDLGGGVETLVLEAVATTDGGTLGSLEVCVAPDTWTAAAPGALDDAPATTCDAEAVPFGRTGDRWLADASSLVRGRSGTTSLAIVPVTGSGAVPFEVAFEAPTAVATGTTPAPAPSGGSSGVAPGGSSSPSASPAPAPSPVSRPSIAPAPPAIATGGAPSGTSPATTVAPDVAEEEPEAAPAVVDGDASSTIELANAGVLDDVVSEPRWGEALVLVLIGLAVGAGTYGTSRLAARRA